MKSEQDYMTEKKIEDANIKELLHGTDSTDMPFIL